MSAATKTPRYIIPDPQPSSREEVMEAMVQATRVGSEEELFQATQQVILRTSYCRAPVSGDLMEEIDRRSGEWETTRSLYRQWAIRCYNPYAPIRTRCRLGCR